MNTRNLMIASIFIGVVGGIVGCVSSLSLRVSNLEFEVALRPPVLVVDMTKLAADSVPVGSGKSAIQQHFRDTQSVVDKFIDAGFIVLSRENIISAPADLMLNVEDLPANRYLMEEVTNDNGD